MCRAARCKTCGKTTWAGCGQHVSRVMAGVPAAQQCTCDRDASSPAGPVTAGLLRRLLRRS